MSSNITLLSGKVVTVDITDMTVKEWRNFVNPKGDTESENVVLRKYAGLTDAEIDAMPYKELRRIVKEIVVLAQEPLKDPS